MTAPILAFAMQHPSTAGYLLSLVPEKLLHGMCAGLKLKHKWRCDYLVTCNPNHRSRCIKT